MNKVTIRPYKIEKIRAKIPPLITRFLGGEFKEILNDLSVKITPEREDTGQGMSYKNRLQVLESDKVLYDTGMLTYRNGRGGYPDNWDQCYRKAGLLRLDDKTLLGIESGTDKVRIMEMEKKTTVETCDVGQAKRDEESGKLNPSNLADLRSHFRSKYNNGNQYPWTIGGQDITCDLGVGFMAYHNGAHGATVWNKCVVILIHEGQAFISDPIHIELVGHDNFYLSEVRGREVVGNKFKVGFVCRRYDSWAGNYRPTFVEFELTL